MLAVNPPQRIYKLPVSLANQIAAGEVIERPASVVKELLENSLDAGAGRITIDIEKGGSQLIRVTDNGSGIHADDLELVFDRHATSKLASQTDLEKIRYLGFRGEALSSIASVSRCRMLTCTDNSSHGRLVELTGAQSTPPSITPVAHPVGTTVEVNDLFFNTPARRKFLRSEKTEFLHIQDLIRRIALSRYYISVKFNHNNRTIYYCNNDEQDPERRLALFFGRSFLKNIIPFDISHDDYRIWGWLGKADAARSHTDRQFFYLNGRIIKDKQVNHAIKLAYNDLIYPGRYPVYILYFETDISDFDINVHPTKHEVRFRNARNVHDFIRVALTSVLQNSDTLNNKTDQLFNNFVAQESVNVKNFTYQINESGTAYTFNPDIENQDKDNFLSIMQGRYVIYEDANDLVLIDVYRTRELIFTVKLLAAWKNKKIKTRPLLVPLSIPVDNQEIKVILDNKDLIKSIGIDIDQIGETSIIIREIPVLLASADISNLMRQIIKIIQESKIPLTARELIEGIKSHTNDAVSKAPCYKDVCHLINELDEIKKEITSQAYNSICQYIDQDSLKKLFR